ncbi:MAG: hypothetical protein JSR54_16030 [Proteobacteria bacterium]|nr:hypothetical protein [Pseudomonadota bacterium]
MIVHPKPARLLAALGTSVLAGAATALLVGVVLPYLYVAATSGVGAGFGDVMMYLLMVTLPVGGVTGAVLALALIPYWYARFSPPDPSANDGA